MFFHYPHFISPFHPLLHPLSHAPDCGTRIIYKRGAVGWVSCCTWWCPANYNRRRVACGALAGTCNNIVTGALGRWQPVLFSQPRRPASPQPLPTNTPPFSTPKQGCARVKKNDLTTRLWYGCRYWVLYWIGPERL
jgi:hypothetical protein